ncbi:MAG: hypothetical protein SAK29_38225 [Scytonema sp. PMC 1069.18]|nr:hypothetical protein [Scytonema sp. PMC 1069.18]MEC4883709.1 hypothetical protein [Scytonema sp. PMC 1070.18]
MTIRTECAYKAIAVYLRDFQGNKLSILWYGRPRPSCIGGVPARLVLMVS